MTRESEVLTADSDSRTSRYSSSRDPEPTMPAKRVALIGLGPGGAITLDALVKEKAFDVIRVFERKDAPGGCWYVDRNLHVPAPCI